MQKPTTPFGFEPTVPRPTHGRSRTRKRHRIALIDKGFGQSTSAAATRYHPAAIGGLAVEFSGFGAGHFDECKPKIQESATVIASSHEVGVVWIRDVVTR